MYYICCILTIRLTVVWNAIQHIRIYQWTEPRRQINTGYFICIDYVSKRAMQYKVRFSWL